MDNFAKLRGCKLHNLKNVDADFPLGKITVVCGPSGCGKSTLVLDTLHGECKRRYLETLSPFASELLGGKRIIPLDNANGLSASLALVATRGDAPVKSYALSLSDCDSALRTLFATFAKPACPHCGYPMECTSREKIIHTIAQMQIGTKLQFLARIETEGASLDKLSAAFLSQGFTRALSDGEAISIADLTPDNKQTRPKQFFIVVDRIIIRENTRTRISEAVDGVLRLTHSEVTLDIEGNKTIFSTVPRCTHCDVTSGQIKPLDQAAFSPYNIHSACPTCSGKGCIENESDKDGEASECPDCGGLRLKKEYLKASIDNISWKDLLQTNFDTLSNKIKFLFEDRITPNLQPSYTSLTDRIDAINELGLGYLTPGRSGTTLSGGEMQRLRLASLSTGHLNGLIIALDEPASGLHTLDIEKLWTVFRKIQQRGNTLVLIEHNPSIIEKADWIIEMGPGAGEKGGEVLFQGPSKQILSNPDSPTANWIKALATKKSKKNKNALGKCIEVNHFSMYDISPISAKFPVNQFSVISGKSGSGKSTLLFKNIARRARANEFSTLGILDLSILSTGDFHGSRRSTILSALGLGSQLRDLFAKLPESKVRGYTAAKFTTHAPGGRCENCKGEGSIHDSSGYEETECPVCLGRRFKDEILDIRFKTLSIADILDLEIKNAYNLFVNIKPIADKLKSLIDTGLDYLRLGQTTSHLSGGERARLRLSIALSKAKAPNTLFLFDEPARGLHQKDIQHLIDLIHNLCKAGHTIIAIEHAKDFIREADYQLELTGR
ncbi:MAG: ABC transporter [Fibrobacter sp.]|nr:ABC transporter [Fibrobacter sp.]